MRRSALRLTFILGSCLAALLAACSDSASTGGGDTPSNGPFPGHTLTWTETVRSPVALYESQGLAAANLLYVFGGYYNAQIHATDSSYAFNPATSQWTNLEPMPEKLTHAGQALYRGDVYIAGGFIGDHPGPPTNHVWVYNIERNSWSAGPALPESLGGGALVELGGRLHFFGGTVRNGDDYLRDSARHWVLDLERPSPAWEEAAPLPTPRNHLAGAAVGGKIYAIGGQRLGDEDYGNLRVVEAYDPQQGSWERVADLPRPLGHISSGTFSYRGRIVVVMGVTQERVKLSDIIAYDPKANAWDSLTPMPGGRSATVAGVIGGDIVLTTGTVAGGPLDTTWVGSWD